jgi:hypothetical protein
MLSVEDEPVVSEPTDSVPVASVPLVAPDNWLLESAAPAAAPAPPRFLSQDEDEKEAVKVVEPAYSAPLVPVAEPAHEAAPLVETATASAPEETEPAGVPAQPKFAELAEEPAYTPLPRDYSSDFGGGARGSAALDESRVPTAVKESSETGEEEQRDLDTPAFMRRLRF